MPTIVFVCTANICRSPVAKALFDAWLREEAIPGEWRVESAGTWAESGAPAASFSREVLEQHGLDLAAHRARRVDRQLVESADLMLCMTRSQSEALRAEFPDRARHIELLSVMAGSGYDVPDPYGGPREGYERMVSEIRHLIEAGGHEIARLASASPA
jgi:protein-tyrosine-phosphatase